MRLGVPFIAPRQLRVIESNPGRQILPSVDWCTGQSGADFFPVLAQPTVGDLESLAHWTLSGAHRTVRCPLQTVGPATRHARIARPTVGSPDSPVNYSRTSLIASQERRLRCGWLTGQSGAPPYSLVIYSHTPSSNPESGLFTRLVLAHRTLSGAPRPKLSLAAYCQLFSKLFSPDSST
jgi:hypothetical protein